ECVPSSQVTCSVPRTPRMKSRIAVARVASTNCIRSPPLSSSTATEIVSRWTSIPTYLTLFIRVFLSVRFGCCCLHQPQPTSKGAPFYNACPILDVLCQEWDSTVLSLLGCSAYV